jgi:hypothetical protein
MLDLEYLRWMIRDNGSVELRHLDAVNSVGWFDDIELLGNEVKKRAGSGNLYTSLNAPRPRRVINRMEGKAITNRTVGLVTRILFDLDPVREPGTNSDEWELDAARVRLRGLVQDLQRLGWRIPVCGMSGNGYHAQYRTKLPNNHETKEMLKHLYSGLAVLYTDYVVKFDVTVRNPGRIVRLYGTINRKGTTSKERPHRRSWVWLPEVWPLITANKIEHLANHFAQQNKPQPRQTVTPKLYGRGDYKTIDAVSWFVSHGLYLHHIERHIHAVRCPWEHEHTTVARNDTVIFEADGGWPGFHCKHSHCEGKDIRDVIALFGNADRFCAINRSVTKRS